jgi:hypothetical protein
MPMSLWATSGHRSLDYINALQKSIGDAQTQRLRSLEVDDELVLGGLLNRYVLRSMRIARKAMSALSQKRTLWLNRLQSLRGRAATRIG